MKKQYIITAIIIGTLILAIFLLGTGFYTYAEANRIIKTQTQYVQNQNDYASNIFSKELTERELIIDLYDTKWEYSSWNHFPNIGFYGFLELNDGTVLDTSSDYCVVMASEDNYFEPDESKIFRFEGDIPFDDKHLYDFTIDAQCDEVFIHGGTLTHHGQTYPLGDFNYQGTESVSFSEWAGDTPKYCNLVKLAGNSYERELNAEAKELLEKLKSDLENGIPTKLEKEDIWTSYSLVIYRTSLGVYATLRLYHPMEIAMRSNTGTYVVLLLALLVVEGAMIFTVRKLYKSRKEYEERSRRLTRGVAHELKTPLAVAKAYVENWDYIDASEREEYSKKITREVDDMADLINSLLEIDKIDSGKVKLNLEEVELSSLIRSIYGRIRPLAEERNLEVLMPEEKEYMVKADLRLLKMVIGNYLTNMVKYAQKKASVEIRRSGRKILVEFKNDIAQDKKNKTEKLNSNGMGLEINENILKLHKFEHGNVTNSRCTIFWFEAEEA